MTETRVAWNIWSGTAVALVVAAVAALVSVLSGPYSFTDTKIFYTLGASLLGAATLFVALALVKRGVLLGWAGTIAAPLGFGLLVYSIWGDARSSLDDPGTFWTGTLTLVTALIAVTGRLLAHAQLARWTAVGAGVFALLASLLSIDAATSNDQFWRVGTPITSLWIVASALFFLVPVLERAISRSDLWLAPAVVVAGAAVVGVVALARGEFSPQGYSIVFTLIAVVLTTSALLGGVISLERGASVFGLTALVVSPLALAMLVEGIWHDSEDRFRFIATGVVLALALLVALHGRLFAVTGGLPRLAGVAGAFAATAAAISVAGIWNDDRYFLFEKTTTALWIVATLCALLVPVAECYLADEDTAQPEAPA